MAYTNSSLASVTILSPSNNHYGERTHAIDRITPHMVVGQCTVESLGTLFYNPNRGATSSYGIGYDGRIGLYCEEKNAPGTSSSFANDNRAVTIEIASDTSEPFAIKSAAYDSVIKLMADICKRNGKTELVWIADKNSALAYNQKSNEMLITLHKWFGATNCPGTYIESHLTDIVTKVNLLLNGSEPEPSPTKTTFEVAQDVIDGKYGNGQARIDALTKAGYNAKEVQTQVDKMLGKEPHRYNMSKLIDLLPTLEKNSTETSLVKIMQTWLKNVGYYTYDIDGLYGDGTTSAVKAFQTNLYKIYKTVTVDGKFNKTMWEYILK